MSETATAPSSIAEGGFAGRIAAMRRHRLAQNFGWYMVGELAVRLSRLVVTIVLARWLVPADFGVAAIAITTFELVRVLASNGSSAFIVRAGADSYEATCAAIQRLSWAVACGLIAIQVIAGYLIAQVTGRADLSAMLALLALAHLAVPLTEVPYARLQRENRLKAIAAATSTQVLCDGVLAAMLAVAGFGAWSIVLPRLLTTPLYVYMLRRASPEAVSCVTPLPLRGFWPFSLPYLGAEMLAALRSNLDKVLVGAVLGVETLGIYTFAFNAGLGITLTLTAALSAALYSHFSEAHRTGGDVRARFDHALARMILPVSLVIALQAAAAVVYVPILFGERWAFAAPFVALICLSALLRPLYDATCQFLRARGETRREVVGASLFTAFLLMSFAAVLATRGFTPALAAFAVLSVVGHATFVAWALRGR